jgi:hypothetical protein
MENAGGAIYLLFNLKVGLQENCSFGGCLSLKVGGFALFWLDRVVLGLFCFCFLQV